MKPRFANVTILEEIEPGNAVVPCEVLIDGVSYYTSTDGVTVSAIAGDDLVVVNVPLIVQSLHVGAGRSAEGDSPVYDQLASEREAA